MAILNEKGVIGEISERDIVVAETIIQWLGSPVGQCFVRDVMEEIEQTKGA